MGEMIYKRASHTSPAMRSERIEAKSVNYSESAYKQLCNFQRTVSK